MPDATPTEIKDISINLMNHIKNEETEQALEIIGDGDFDIEWADKNSNTLLMVATIKNN